MIEINAICDDVGLDTISTGGVIACMMELTERKIYSDHYHFTQADLDQIYESAVRQGSELIVCTEKDWSKITKLRLPEKQIPFAYLAVEIGFTSGEDEIRQLIKKALASKID